MQKTVLLITVLLFNTLVFSQHLSKCFSDGDILKSLDQRYLGYANATLETFEQALQKVQNKQAKGTSQHDTIFKIPVVVHIVYNTPNENIHDSLAQNQIEVLNQDFRRLNSDTNNTRSFFKPVAADAGIEFYLATTDPQGNPTNGITRTQTSKTNFGGGFIPNPATVDEVKNDQTDGKSPWPTDNYLNIWVCNTGGSILGLAYPPAAAPNWPQGEFGDSSVQGVVVHYEVFGRGNPRAIGQLSIADYGRTCVHEVGHFLGLRHIWGDGPLAIFGQPDCSVDDGIDDTPNAGTNSQQSGCDFNKNTCTDATNDLPDMVENYMDYSTERCQNTFTNQQVAIMRNMLVIGRPGLADLYDANGNLLTPETPNSVTQIEKVKLKIYPNPAQHKLTIRSNSTINTIKLYTINGQLVETIKVNGTEHTFNVANLPKGVYSISINNNQLVNRKKIIVR